MKLYIIVRNDLSPGAQIAQSCHALREFCEKHKSLDEQWFSTSNYIVCLSAKSEQHLKDILDKCEQRGLPIAEFREPDMDNQITAISVGPDEQAKKLLSNLPLALSK